jgi:hypothetical protein
MLDNVKDKLGSVTCTTRSYARRVGRSTSALARRVGPRRGGIALGLIAAAVGVPFLVRYLRARRAEAQARELENLDADVVIIASEVQPIPANAPIGPGLA